MIWKCTIVLNYIICIKSVYIYIYITETPKVIAKYELSRYADIFLEYQPLQDRMEIKTKHLTTKHWPMIMKNIITFS
jgi:hypothetical protein